MMQFHVPMTYEVATSSQKFWPSDKFKNIHSRLNQNLIFSGKLIIITSIIFPFKYLKLILSTSKEIIDYVWNFLTIFFSRFLRVQKEYTPPADVESRLENIFKSVLGSTSNETKLDEINRKFKVLTACAAELDHEVPSSRLHTIENLGDLRRFYNTPIDVKTPLDKMRNMELPENLHIQFEYYRFHPGNHAKLHLLISSLWVLLKHSIFSFCVFAF